MSVSMGFKEQQGTSRSTLTAIEGDIKRLSAVAGSALRVGGLLVLAREHHKSQAAFLEWADANVGIKKAQAYRLIKVHQVFGEDARFQGVAMRVLNMLAGAPVEVLEKAAALQLAGKLGSSAAETLTHMVVEIDKPVQLVALAPTALISADEVTRKCEPSYTPSYRTQQAAAGFDVIKIRRLWQISRRCTCETSYDTHGFNVPMLQQFKQAVA